MPTHTECPTFDGFTICGGRCGGCPLAEVCTGRSRLHPYSACLPKDSKSCSTKKPGCGADQGGFIYTVEPEAQPYADENAACVPLATCLALAAEYPGGATCIAP